jgi:hypothetical protein
MTNNYKEVILETRKEIEQAKNTRVWQDYINALKLISQVVFTRSSGFILEFIQNAEDSGLNLNNTGNFKIEINQKRIKIIHNGAPFSQDDVKAICGIASSKKPEKGNLGYLGIGFKSVCKVSDAPEIYSGGFQFKFDRKAQKHEADNLPWYVIPIWIDTPSESIDSEKTTFIIPFSDDSYYDILIDEIDKLNIQLYLFLHWLKEIDVKDEVTGNEWTLENLGSDSENIVTLKQNGNSQKFKIFSHILRSIPDYVVKDSITQEYRSKVKEREITIAFALDEDNNLAPVQAGAMYGGVYSFIPLGEAKSGAKFPIQADFLVQPGRDAINYEANWNHWLVKEIANLCKESINFFRGHPKWKFQLLPVFEFTKSVGLESYDKLFAPELIDPIEKYLEDNDCIPTQNGTLTKIDKAAKLAESDEASNDIVSMGILSKDEIAPILGGEPDLQLVDSNVKESLTFRLKEIDREGLLSNTTFLEIKRKGKNSVNWFYKLYLWLKLHPRQIRSRKGNYYDERYTEQKIILTSKNELQDGRNVWLLDFNEPLDPILTEVAKTLEASKDVLQPGILANAKDEEERKALRGFLLGFTGVQVLDTKTICKEAILPRILTINQKPSASELVQLTQYCKKYLADEVPVNGEYWILDKTGDVKAASKLLLPKEFNPEQDWETYSKYVPGLNFVTPLYLGNAQDIEGIKEWREVFYRGGVHKTPDNGVEIFAVNYVEDILRKDGYTNIIHVDKLNLGYDIQANTNNGDVIYIEVKGKTQDQEIELTANEVEAADNYKDAFYLCIVSSIPDNPTMYMIKNPALPGIGKKDKITIPVNIWKAYKY